MRTATSHAVSVRRWRNVYLVARDHPAPERVKDRLDESLRATFDPGAAEALAAGLNGEAALVFIKQLQLDVAVDASWDRDRIAAAWSGAFARQLLEELAAGPSGNVVRFSTRASWLAGYLIERAAGGRGAWFHQACAGWSLLTTSAAIRTALCDDPETGRASLAELSPPVRATVASALTEPDVAAVIRDLGSAGAPTIEGVALLLQAAADSLDAVRRVSAAALPVWLLGANLGRPVAEILVAARLLAALPYAQERVPAADARTWIISLCRDPGVLVQCVGARAPLAFDELRAILIDAAQRAAAQGAVTRTERFTRYGGAFLLLDDVCEDDPLTQLLILGRCLSRDMCLLLGDDCWRDLYGIARAITRASVEHSTERVRRVRRGARETLRRFATRLPGFGGSSAGYLRANFLACTATLTLEPERIVVVLTRPPLDLILNMSGRNRGERRWPWLDARPFVLFPED